MDYLNKLSNRYLAPCPVCGKRPVMSKTDLAGCDTKGVCVVAQCKPIFRKPHIRVKCVADTEQNAINKCISEYNMIVINHVRFGNKY